VSFSQKRFSARFGFYYFAQLFVFYGKAVGKDKKRLDRFSLYPHHRFYGAFVFIPIPSNA